MEETALYSDAANEKLEDYVASLAEYAKEADRLLPIATSIRNTPEWGAFKRFLKIEMGKTCTKLGLGATKELEYSQGFIRGLDFVIGLAEVHLPKAMDKKKQAIAEAKSLTKKTD